MKTTQYSASKPFTRTGGWPGGTVTSLAILPKGDLLAGTMAGLFRSSDTGQSWSRVTNGPSDPAILTLSVAPRIDDEQEGDEAELFATTEGGRLYCSPDGGKSWPEVTSWIGLGVGVALAISPNYVADGTLFVATADGPLRSQDRGISWESSTFGLLDVDTLCIACSPDFAQDETLWAGTAFGGFFSSRNGGRSWRESGTGLPDAAVQCLALADDGTLFAGTEADGVFRSTDGGGSWQRAGGELDGFSVNSLAALPGVLLAGTSSGLYRSEDRGLHWHACTNGDFAAFALAGQGNLAGHGNLVVAGSWQAGVFSSVDMGASWQAANGDGVGLLAAHTPPLAVLTPRHELYVVDSDGGSALSTNSGQSWERLDFLDEDETCDFIAGAGQGEQFTLFAWAGESLYRQVGGGTWQRSLAPGNGASHLAVSPSYAADGALLLVDADNYLYLSEDRGESWQELEPPEVDGDVLGVAISPFFTEDLRCWLVTGAFDGSHIQVSAWQTDDAGRTWTDVAGLALDTPAISLLPLADSLRRPLLLAAQNRLITLYTDPENGELAVEQRFLADDLQIIGLAQPHNGADEGGLMAATNRGLWHIPSGNGDAVCIGLAEHSVVALFPREDVLKAVTLGGEVWQQSG